MRKIIKRPELALVLLTSALSLVCVGANTTIDANAAAAAQSGRGRMAGFVVDETDVHGVTGATVELRGDPASARLRSVKVIATTNEKGEYEFKNVPYGDYALRITAAGFTTYEINLYILSDAVTQLHVKLRKTKGVQIGNGEHQKQTKPSAATGKTGHHGFPVI